MVEAAQYIRNCVVLALWKRELRTLPFPNWQFYDLTGVDLDHEKPPVQGDQAIHDATGAVGAEFVVRAGRRR
jgi:hypothetical protein